MIELWIWFRSQGTQWPLRAGDRVQLRVGEQRLEFAGELILQLVQHHVHALEIQRAMLTGEALRKPLAPSTPDLLAQRRLSRRTRRQ